jgi:anthranilate synthase component 2
MDFPHILIIDNYDSFSYNLVQGIGTIANVDVSRNDAMSIEEIQKLDPDGIIVSPGPGFPQGAGVSMSIFSELTYPTLGVCLGYQALCAANGVSIIHAPSVVHGKISHITHDGSGVLSNLPNPFVAGRYHSLTAEESSIPDFLIPTAWTLDEVPLLMGVRHTKKPHEGVQFHPESFLTPLGTKILENFCLQCLK